MWLILSRKEGEEIVVGDEDVVFCVSKIRSGRVKIAIRAASRDISIRKREDYERLKKNGVPAPKPLVE